MPPISRRSFLLAGAGDVVVAGDVAGGKHADHAGRRRRLGQIEPAQAAAGDRAQHQRGMERARRLGNVVDIERLAGDVLERAVVALGGVDLAFHSASISTARSGSAMRQ